jgi:hypothetical protein
MNIHRLACLAVLFGAAAVQAQHVKPPPLPPGSDRVKPQPGLDPVEVKRSIQAHHHKGHIGKDYTADDTANGGRAIARNPSGGKK